ncbi:LysE/ArgO family amino acid transporter [Candidatus Pelagibacter communis]|uniref:LysE/ArgO family amino acid transporter n=1 Tax=Pelagibacter ubique TaxID=198252 RepID=UPI00094D27F2|nr:LysE family transporter [Candidatus Pelagibacter ubique]
MSFLILGFLTSLSLILAIGPQNIFVIEQGIKKQHIFLICFICSVSDTILIFLGIFLFQYVGTYFNEITELIFNILLLIFLIYFIYTKISEKFKNIEIDKGEKHDERKKIILKTLAFTYLNPHVYSDTVFFLGNFSKNFPINYKIYFGIGGSIASFLFFYLLGYLANYFSKYLNNVRAWVVIKWIISLIMSLISIYVIFEILKFFN